MPEKGKLRILFLSASYLGEKSLDCYDLHSLDGEIIDSVETDNLNKALEIACERIEEEFGPVLCVFVSRYHITATNSRPTEISIIYRARE